MKFTAKNIVSVAVLLGLAMSLLLPTAHARSNKVSAISEVSALPIASVAIVGSAASAASASAVPLPLALAGAGSTLVVKSVTVSARGTICLLERASDGAQVSVEIAARGVQSAALVVGKTVQIVVVGAGVVLSVAGEAIAFVPNEIGRALMHHERLTF